MGGGHHGTREAPVALRDAGLVSMLLSDGHQVRDLGDVDVDHVDRTEQAEGAIDQGILEATTRACHQARRLTMDSIQSGGFPITIGGDHSLAAGSLAGIAAARRLQDRDAPGLLWFDAHADLNTAETTPTGNLHGMSGAALLGWKVPGLSEVVGTDGIYHRHQAAFLAPRDMDAGEQRHMDSGQMLHVTHDHIKSDGVVHSVGKATERATAGTSSFALSFDVDVIDPSDAPGVDTAVHGGPKLDVVLDAVRQISSHDGLIGVDVVEFNPINDRDDMTLGSTIEVIRMIAHSITERASGRS